MFLLLGSFLAGVLTVLAPCVLMLLPIIIGGSVTGDNKDKKRPLIIAGSLGVSLIVFTLLLKATTLLIDVSPRAITIGSGAIIISIGILMLLPNLYAKAIAKLGIEHRTQTALGKSFQNKSSITGPILIGAVLGPVFSSCSPVYAYILATVLPVNFSQAFAYIISYVLGLSLVLLLIGYYGQSFVSKIKFASDPKGWFQRTIAVLFILAGLLIATGYDKRLQTWVSTHTPFNFDSLSSQLLPDSKNKVDTSKLLNVEPYDAPEFVGLENWINSDPQKLGDLKGKVVLVDFWTYSCINCIRNNPYLIKWYETYKNDGFVVIGMHAPEFAFEKVPANVEKAVRDQKITYPVALDNDFATWNAYQNRSWPASYLIDAEGKVRRVHEGEGQYKETEDAIRALLQENGKKLSKSMTTNTMTAPITEMQTPETYLGTKRASNFAGSPPLGKAKLQDFTHADSLKQDYWSLGGKWETGQENIISRGGSSLKFKISGKEIYIVAGAAAPTNMTVKLNGKPVTDFAGPDVKNGVVQVGEYKLYRLVSYPELRTGDILELELGDGISLNAFTFGS